MMDLFNQLIFSPDPDFESISKGFGELQEEISRSADPDPQSPVVKTGSDAMAAAGSATDNVEPESAKDPADRAQESEGIEVNSTVTTTQSPVIDPNNTLADTSPKKGSADGRSPTGSSEDAAIEPQSTQSTVTPLTAESKHMVPSVMIPTDYGYIDKVHWSDGTESTQHFKTSIRNGQKITERIAPPESTEPEDAHMRPEDSGFFALAYFFDCTLRDSLPRQSGAENKLRLPIEAIRLIINSIDDMGTYRSCMRVSHLFRDICMENFRVDNASVFLASEVTRDDDIDVAVKATRDETLVFNTLDRASGDKEELLPQKPKQYMSEGNKEIEYTWYVVAGKEKHQRVLLLDTATAF